MKYVASAANVASGPSRRTRVLIASDEPLYRARLKTILHAREYEVEEVDSTEALQDLLRRGSFELIVLGIKTRWTAHVVEACRCARKLSPGSGIVLISTRTPEDSAGGEGRADGLEAGADDYITASIESREFLARIRAVLRRIRPSESSKQVLRSGDLEIDIDRRHLRRNGEAVHLTRREFDLLSILMQTPGTSFTHLQLLRSVWGPDYGSELEYLRAYIRLLRRKIDIDPARPSYIRTVPGVGYCFQDPFDS